VYKRQINRRLAALSSFYRFLALTFPTAPDNPIQAERHYIRRRERLPRDVQDPVLERLFAVITGPRDRTLFLLMLRCGLRVSEVRNLSLNDLYLEPNHGSLPRVWIHGKGGKQRVMYLSHQPLNALKMWLALRPKSQDQAVFLNRSGRRLSVTGIQNRLASYCRQVGVWVTCHQLRHTFGRHLTEQRVPVTTIQRLLGHTHLHTTELYLNIANVQLQEDYEHAMQAVMEKLPLVWPQGGCDENR
jgi:site-specific recombinase XerC